MESWSSTNGMFVARTSWLLNCAGFEIMALETSVDMNLKKHPGNQIEF